MDGNFFHCREAAMTLHLAEHLLARGRTLHRLGLVPEAARLFKQLVSFRELPGDIAEQTHRHLAELHLEQGRCRLARRSLAAALAQQPEEAHYHYLMGVAVLEDSKGEPRRALGHFYAALRHDADNAEYQVQFGLLAVALAMPRRGVRALRRAAALAPNDPDVLGRVAEGLRDLGKHREARALLKQALFSHPRDRRFRNLWDRHQFQLLHDRQDAQAKRWTMPADKPVILKFPRRRLRLGARTIRRDAPSAPKGPTIIPARIGPRKKAK
jgi:tetratricopeptide (TPR) repeat protein